MAVKVVRSYGRRKSDQVTVNNGSEEDVRALEELRIRAQKRLANPRKYEDLFAEIHTRMHDPTKLIAVKPKQRSWHQRIAGFLSSVLAAR